MVINEVVPRLPSRKRTAPITTLVLHATAGGSAESSIRWHRTLQTDDDEGNEASYHYVIERDGTMYKCVNTSRVAFHAGKSVGPQGSNVNEYSIGISLANWQGYKGRIEGYPAKQMAALDWLIGQLVDGIPSLKYITTHRIISPTRRSDPMGVNLQEYAEKFPKLKAWRKTKSQSWTGPAYP
jgi:N-acetylmuramoyl-L-alanine amidase